MSNPPESTPYRIPGGPRFILPPWRVALFGAPPALLLAFLYGLFPNLESIRLPLLAPFPTAYMLAPLTLMLSLWGVAAMVRRKKDQHVREAVLGLTLSLAALGITIVAALGYAAS